MECYILSDTLWTGWLFAAKWKNGTLDFFDFAFSMSEIGVMPPARWLVLRDATTLHGFAPTVAAVAHPRAAPCSRARRW